VLIMSFFVAEFILSVAEELLRMLPLRRTRTQY